MPDEVILDVTTIEENVTVETTAGDVVEIQVVAPTGNAATVEVGTTTTGAAGTNASVTNSGTTSAAVFNFTIPRGDTGAAGASGGSSTAWRYRAKTNATSGYPTNGHLLWNNATQTSATEILVSHLDDEGSDIEFFLSFFLDGQKIFIQNRDDSSQNQVWEISGTPTVTNPNTSTAYYTFPVTLISSAGAAFTNNHSILFGSIAAAVNAVTSATTSDGTANLDVASLEIFPNGSISLASTNSGGVVILSGQAATDARSIAFPNASGNLALVASTTGAIASADITDATSDGNANKEKVLKTDSQGSLTVTNSFGVNAGFRSSLTVGDGDSVIGLYDIFSNTSHLQWYSDTFLYGEREFIITTENLTFSGAWVYKYPAASGTFAVTASTTGVPDKLTDGTIAGTLAINTTSYTYGTGAAAAHVTALGLPIASSIVTLTGTQELLNKTLTSPTIGTSATFNATTYTYGAGAALAHRTALGVGTRLSALASNTSVTNTTTLQTVASLPVVAGKSYAVYAQIAIDGTVLTGTRHGLTFPASTFIRMTRKRLTSYTPVEVSTNLNLGLAETSTLAELVGFITVTVTGTVELQFAQNTANANTTTCRTFTYLTLTELV
jgi:hypothetical protein